MKLILSVHVLYLVAILAIVARHAVSPILHRRKIETEMESIKQKYNEYARYAEENTAEIDVKTVRMLRELVIYSDVLGCAAVSGLLVDTEKKSREIHRLYEKLNTKINMPHAIPLKYSLECNLGILCSLILPAALVVITNLKGLIKKYPLRHCFTKHIYGERRKNGRKH
ncbi:hypothetical protein NEMIN01_1588 [Nematocida minor]|uniref:uncharacterized protein n=1 Tax=Nematocida minor TaxID=1912983 RepID=UPI00221F3E3D|nr:uncharacterized protein NEMIN01_1588 [Nematocida minor]KAI5191604.1 hypothetical protein NEMIN01_1588 [Nematocida minor]